jgi:hypothetical protein
LVLLVSALSLQIAFELLLWLIFVVLVEVAEPLVYFGPHLILVEVLLLIDFLFLCVVLKSFDNFSSKPDFPKFINDFVLSFSNDLVFLHYEVLKFNPSQKAPFLQVFVMNLFPIVNAIKPLLFNIVFQDSQSPQL